MTRHDCPDCGATWLDCERCGQTVQPTRAYQRYCSRLCKEAAKDARKRARRTRSDDR